MELFLVIIGAEKGIRIDLYTYVIVIVWILSKTSKKEPKFDGRISACVSTLGSIIDLFLTPSQFLEAHDCVLDIMYQRAI